jgi:uncharacterized membrane protein YecN with MAPEG domain
MVVLELVAGLFFPRIAFVSGVLIVIGRQLYGMGYRKSGPSGRAAGGGISALASIVLLIVAVYGM